MDAREHGSEEDLQAAEAAYRAAVDRRNAIRSSLVLAVLFSVAAPIGVCLAAICLLSGCRTSAPEPIILNDHVRLVSPGDTVPELPQGETRWWLLTPRGMDMVSPLERRP